MKPVKPLFCILVALAAPLAAQTYQWKDAGGRTMISDAPPPKNTTSRSIATPAAATGDLAEREMEFRKRRREADDSTARAERESTQRRQRRETCERARQALATLESGREVSSLDDRGEGALMSDAERLQEITRLREMVGESCK